jgi:hypothetical protein
MNRLAMAEEIARRVPMLAHRDQDEWKRAEQLRKDFVSDYPSKRIPSLPLDDYVIGKGANNRSFCYRLEREMDSLGRILGATAFKFGVYFGRIKSDPADKYRFRPHWGKTVDQVFAAVKQAIVDLLQAADKDDFDAIAGNKLSPMFKGKILFLYHPDQFAPIYAWPHLEHFITELDLDGAFECEADMQRALMDYRSTWPELKAQPPALYMRLLYDVFGPPDAPATSGSAALSIPMLKTAVDGAQFIGQLPAMPPAKPAGPAGHGKTNHEALQKRSKRTGDRGELIVLALEKQRFIAAGKPKLAQQIDHIAQRDDWVGFDILSFDDDGTERPIEVKATTAPNLQNGFYISANELEKSAELPNYHLYIVFSALSKSPRVFRMKQPNLKGLGFELEPLNYHVTHSGNPL